MTIGFIYTGSTYATPDKQLTKASTPRVLTAKFGDGYEQRAVDGINNLAETYTLTFKTRPKADIDGKRIDAEGYVLHSEHGSWKLVDREVFSYANFRMGVGS